MVSQKISKIMKTDLYKRFRELFFAFFCGYSFSLNVRTSFAVP